jgi:subfamily B ATP-binding cassette protein MsbA
MKSIIRILAFAKNYKRYAVLNVVFNVLSVIFSMFSVAMLYPFLQVLFSDDDAKLQQYVANGVPSIGFSAEGILNYANYYLAKISLERGRMDALVYICLFVIISIFFKNLFRYLAMYFLAPIRNGIVMDLRNSLFDKTMKLSLSFYSNERKGDIMARMTADVKEVEFSVMNSLEMMFRDPINILVFLVMMITLSFKLSLFVFVMLPLTGLIVGRIAKSLRKTSVREKEEMGFLLSIIDETLSGMRIITAFNAQQSMRAKFRKSNSSYTKYMVSVYRKTDLSSPLSEFLGVSVLVSVMYFGGLLVLGNNPSMTGAIFITYIGLFAQLIQPAKSFTTAYYNIQKGIASLERINTILDADETIKENATAKSTSTFEREILFNNVSFEYQRGDNGYVLKDVNLKIEKGKCIALVGQSGSGKSTLADMLPRFYDVNKGEVLIDGTNVKDLKLNDLRSLMGIVSQESILFNDTVFNNIAFGIDNATEADVIAAAKVANADEFITKMPNGYYTNIGDRGNKMSGGQRQRLSIARAVLKNPPVLILDEATSALDTESERLVQDALNKLMKNRTSIIIAHRLSTIIHADEIIVLQKGEITERGNHQQLLAKNGTYKKLHDLQTFV